ncbi:hypothetical protein PIB30_032397 [Stylosanthes scabra]|uniref:F-box domain-containing protein n=1 Tax=Stylosanthes scabra TaxID=79078 RepID=A0ABU6WC29_9FABA|nr:hypothetical protein [Stylosanthes scabra]
MGDTPPATFKLPQLGDEIMWRIFTKLDPKNVARCRALNRRWPHQNSKFFVRVNVDTKEELNVEFPSEIRGFWNYSIIGSDHGIICLKFERAGLIFGIMIWNPLTRQRHYCNDESRKHLTHAVSALAFGHIFDTLDYAIVHVFKKVLQLRSQNLSSHSISIKGGFVKWMFPPEQRGPTTHSRLLMVGLDSSHHKGWDSVILWRFFS